MNKKILFFIFITPSLLFTLPNHSISSDWKYIVSLKEGDIYLESDTVKHAGSIKTFRYMCVDRNGEVNEVKCSMDCNRKALTFIEHWESGPSLPVVKLSHRPNWIEFPPDSIWDKFYKFLCTETKVGNPHIQEHSLYKNTNKVLTLKPEESGIVKESTSEESNFIIQKVSLDKRQQSEVKTSVEKPTIFAVQVGAFRYSSNARSLAKKLQKKGYIVQITPLEKKEGILFRVRVGRFQSIQEAENLSEKIRKIEGLQTFITLL